MNRSYWLRWLRGWGLLLRAWLILFVAFGPVAVLQPLIEGAKRTHWAVFVILLVVYVLYYFLVMPVVFDWAAHKVGFPLRPEGHAAAEEEQRGRESLSTD
jgi:hypothetical protein